MKKYIIVIIAMLFSLSIMAQRKTVTDKLQVTGVKNAEVLKTDAKGNVVKGKVDLTPITAELGKKVDEVVLDGLYGGKSEVTSGRFLYLLNNKKLKHIKDTLINTSGTSTLLRTVEAQDGSSMRHTLGFGNEWNPVEFRNGDIPFMLGSKMEFRDAKGNIRGWYENRANSMKIDMRGTDIKERLLLWITEKNLTFQLYGLKKDGENMNYILKLNKAGIIAGGSSRRYYSSFKVSDSIINFNTTDRIYNFDIDAAFGKGSVLLGTWRTSNSSAVSYGTFFRLNPHKIKLGFASKNRGDLIEDTYSGITIERISNGSMVKISHLLKLKPMAAPSNPQKGMIYFDSTDNKLKCYDGTTWHNLF